MKNKEPVLVKKGELNLKSSGYKFAHEVCPGFPVALGSDTQEQDNLGIEGACTVHYKGKKLFLTDDRETFTSVLNVFRKTYLKYSYGEMTDKELLEVLYDMPPISQRYIYYRPAHFEEISIYLLRHMERSMSRAKTFEKYTSGKDLIYVWLIPTNEEPGHKKVVLISKDFHMTCLGSDCLEYLGEIRR